MLRQRATNSAVLRSQATFLITLCSVFLAQSLLIAQSEDTPTTIILVRHAEKDTMSQDPPLSVRGRERARRLARLLRESGVKSTHSTQFRRTVETMLPLDSLLGVGNEVVSVDPDSIELHAKRMTEHFLSAHRREIIVAASHSNVLPSVISALGIEGAIKIGDNEYDNVFIVTVTADGKSSMLRLHVE